MEIIEVKQAEMLNAINKAEVDIQVATAKQYPRDIQHALTRIKDVATIDTETAMGCFYRLERKGKEGKSSVIEGVSVRLAEIIAGAWGNLRIQTRIIGNDGRQITAQGVCHDLETNVAVSVEVKRRITTKDGKTFSDDMQTVTGNAASSIAFRNAVLKVVPKAVTAKAIAEIKQTAMGQIQDLGQWRQQTLAWYASVGVSQDEVLEYLDLRHIEDIGREQIFNLRGVANAINEGTTTVDETFKKPRRDAELAAQARKASEAKSDRVAQAMTASQKQQNATDDAHGAEQAQDDKSHK